MKVQKFIDIFSITDEKEAKPSQAQITTHKPPPLRNTI